MTSDTNRDQAVTVEGGTFQNFRERLASIVGLESVRSFAQRCSVAEGTLRAWMAGRSEPTMANLVALAKAGDCSVEWLVTGSDPSRDNSSEETRRVELDLELMRQIIEGVEEGLEIAGLEQAPDGKAQFILTIYNWFKNANPENPKEEVLRLFVPDGKERIGGGSARRDQSDDEDVPPKAAR
ncbi:MAG: helix-turn-helix transcriptional regulator [Methylotetracoccus sp.]